ncbi:MAG: alpha/beta fold hydrolase [Deltaproteobacteria bacterium]|nr:alpha/beta fold hydrolase [Deltaproteobacteria bacterium]
MSEPTFPEGTEAKRATLASGVTLRYFERGKGDVILFLHGFPELALSWRAQFRLAEHGFRCVAPDLRGYGESDAPKNVADYAIGPLMADVVGIIDAVGAERVHLVGHDWGGAIAWEVARNYPDRIRTLSVLNCPPGPMMRQELLANPRQALRSWYMVFFQLPWLPERVMLRDPVTFMIRAFRGSAAKETRERFTADDVLPYARAHERTKIAGVNYYRAALRKPPKIAGAKWPLEMPVQLVWGLQDGALGPWFADEKRYEKVAKDFRVVTLAEAGHWVQQEAPERVNAALLEHMSLDRRQ